MLFILNSSNVVNHANMAGEARNDFYASEVRKFNSCREALNELVYEDTDEAKKCLKNLLDDLIAIEYSLKLANEQVTK